LWDDFPSKKKRDQLIKRAGKRTSPPLHPPRQYGAYYPHPMKCREGEKQELALQEYGMELASADSG